MGLPIARNLARAGFVVRAWNRSPEKAKPLAREGVEVLESPTQAAAGADIILTMLADADAVTETIEEALAGEHTAEVWLQMSTVGEEGTERCIALAREHGLEFVDAPVLGTKQPAEEGKLVVLAAGPEHLRERLQPAFDAVAQRTIWVGAAGSATRLKLATNSWVLTVVEGTAETMALAEGLSLDPALVLDALSGGTLDLPYLQMKGKAIIEGNFEPSFRLKLAAKDARLIEESAALHQLDLPLFATIRARFEQGAKRHGDEDMIATYFASAPRDRRAA